MGATPMPTKIQCSRCANYFTDDHEAAVHVAGCRQYNGWTNYETWAVALWIDNERGSHEFWRERAQELSADHPPAADGSPGRTAVQCIARELEDAHDEAVAERHGNASDVFTDLLNAALSEVDWIEIAQHFFEE